MSSIKDVKRWINQSSWRRQDALRAEESSVVQWASTDQQQLLLKPSDNQLHPGLQPDAAGLEDEDKLFCPVCSEKDNLIHRVHVLKAVITQNSSGHRWSHLFVRAAGRHVKLCRWMTQTWYLQIIKYVITVFIRCLNLNQCWAAVTSCLHVSVSICADCPSVKTGCWFLPRMPQKLL